MKKQLLVLIAIVWQQAVSAQQLPKVIPPSPQSQEFFKHLDYPAGNSSGTVNYSIPIYEVKSGSLGLPISIGYMSGGSKAADMPGDIGYGWTLNAGGRISRTIYGKPDEQYDFPAVMKSINSSEEADDNFDYVASLFQSIAGNSALPLQDTEYDIYSYSLGGNSGKFIYNPYDLKVHTIPEKPYLIGGIKEEDDIWTIVDDKGVTYKYNTTETVSVSVGLFGSFPTSKLLDYIISADKKDTISFVYQQMANQTSTSTTATVTAYDDFTSRLLVESYPTLPLTTVTNVSSEVRTYVVWTVKEIRFRGGKVTFTLNGTNSAIDLIRVFDREGALVRQAQLLRSGTAGYLTDVRFKDVAGTDKEKYGFEYYPSNGGTFQQDFYGYLYTPGGLVPQHTGYYSPNVLGSAGVPGFTAGTGGFVIPSTHAMIGMLKKVIYPTGGTAEYTYELNSAQSGPAAEVVNSGGMRLAETKLTEGNGNVHYRTYRYGTNECGYGMKRLMIPYNTLDNGYEQLSYEMRVFPWLVSGYPHDVWRGSSYRMRVYTSDFLPQVAEVGQEATFYPEVTEYEGTLDSNVGKTVYKYDADNTGSRYVVGDYPLYGSPPYYPSDFVTGSGGYFTGLSSDSKLWPRSHIQQFDLWKTFPMIEKTVYKNSGGGVYAPVSKLENLYSITQTGNFMGLHTIRNIQASTTPFYEGSGDSYAAHTFKLPVFLYDNYYVTTGREDLLSTTETLYTPSGNLVTTTSYEYNANNQVNKVTTTESTGDTRIKTMSYARDYPSTEPYANMVTRNLIAPTIEEKSYKSSVSSGNFLQSTKTEYSFWDGNGQPTSSVTNAVYPKLVSLSKTTSGYEPRMEYAAYDAKGNITSARNPSGPYTSYIWGYNQQYPVAQAINAPIKNIFHQNFEESAGNSALNDARTGHYSRNTAYTVSLTGLDAGKYIYSYWKKTGGVWTFTTSTVTVAGSTYSNTITPLSGELIDDVCFYPESAQMSTYTYDLLIGTTSATDPRGETTYYEYDSYQRLMNVKDKDGNIIKHHDYHYKN